MSYQSLKRLAHRSPAHHPPPNQHCKKRIAERERDRERWKQIKSKVKAPKVKTQLCEKNKNKKQSKVKAPKVKTQLSLWRNCRNDHKNIAKTSSWKIYGSSWLSETKEENLLDKWDFSTFYLFFLFLWIFFLLTSYYLFSIFLCVNYCLSFYFLFNNLSFLTSYFLCS